MDKNGTMAVNEAGHVEAPQPARGETIGQRGNRRGGLAARLNSVMIRRVPYATEIIRTSQHGPEKIFTRYRTDERYWTPEQLVRRSTYNRRKRQTHRRRR